MEYRKDEPLMLTLSHDGTVCPGLYTTLTVATLAPVTVISKDFATGVVPPCNAVKLVEPALIENAPGTGPAGTELLDALAIDETLLETEALELDEDELTKLLELLLLELLEDIGLLKLEELELFEETLLTLEFEALPSELFPSPPPPQATTKIETAVDNNAILLVLILLYIIRPSESFDRFLKKYNSLKNYTNL